MDEFIIKKNKIASFESEITAYISLCASNAFKKFLQHTYPPRASNDSTALSPQIFFMANAASFQTSDY